MENKPIVIDFSKGFNLDAFNKLADNLPVDDITRRSMKAQAQALEMVDNALFGGREEKSII